MGTGVNTGKDTGTREEPAEMTGQATGSGSKGKNKRMRTVWKVLLWIAGIWAALLVIIQLALSPAVLTRLADNFAGQYVDGEVSFGKVRLSVFRSFPYLNVGFSDVSVTYPSDRFPAGGEDFYSRQGKGETADTLASFRRLYVSIDAGALVFGRIRIPGLLLEKPRIFAKSYADGTANWNIFRTTGDSSDAGADTASAEMPEIRLGKIAMTGNPRIVYSSPADTVFAMVNLKRMRFNGRLSIGGDDRQRIGFRIDSMFIAGRLPSDTLALRLDRLGAMARRGEIGATASATAFMATKSYGRLRIPVDIKAAVTFPEDSAFCINIKDLEARVADIPLKAEALVRYDDRLYIKGGARIEKCRINDVLGYFRDNILKAASDIETDATISIGAEADGYYVPEDGIIPAFSARLSIPASEIGNKLLNVRHEIALDTDIEGKSDGTVNMSLKNFHIRGKALAIAAAGTASDILGDDPTVRLDARAGISLDTLSRYLKKKSGLEIAGDFYARINGTAALSQLDPYQLAQADISGEARSRGLRVISEKDTLSLFADSLDIWLGAVGNTRDKAVAQGERMLALTASLDSTFISYKDRMRIIGKSLSVKAQNSAAILNKADSSRFYPFGGRLEIGRLSLVGADTSFAAVSRSSGTFKISPKADNPKIPVLTLDCSNGGIFLRGPVNRIALRDIDINATAAMNSIERRQRAKAFVDSLARRYPDVPRDSLFRHLRRQRGGQRQLPDWLSEKDFMKQDLNLKLSDSMAKYFREWDIDGRFTLGRAMVMSPYFPLRNSLSDISASVNNNAIRFDGFRLRSGSSSLSASGEVTGLRTALLGRGFINLKLDVNSDRLNLNELLGAYAAGAEFVPENTSAASLDISDDEYLEMIAADSLSTADTAASPLIVVPANIKAALSLKAADVTYAGLTIDSMSTDITIKERCIQLTNTIATSDIGDFRFEGFYSTRTKKDLKTGFDLELADVTAEKVIEMMPAVDSMMPMLKSFKGRLNCVVSATAALDTLMSIETPTINGVLRITGDNLELSESTAFSEIARKLKFKDRSGGHIDHMSVEGLIADNRVEIFPFVLKVDRYTLAMSGIQNLDSSFKYHVSVIESPIPFRLGIDLSGNFNDFKFRIGKAKYKSADVPVFSGVIEKTRINLRESIRNIYREGVEKAIAENEQQKIIGDYKKKINYSRAVDRQLDSLSAEEKAQIE